MITRRLAHCQKANSFCKTEKCSRRREDWWIRDACFHNMWKSFANCRNTLSFYHFLFLHLLALFRCNGNSKSIWNWFLEPIQHTVCTSIVGIWILWQFHRKSFVVPLFLLLKFANHYNNHTKIVEASAIHVVLKHQKICMRMHNAQGQDRVRESVCTCNKKITLFIYSFTLAISWTSHYASSNHPNVQMSSNFQPNSHLPATNHVLFPILLLKFQSK